MRLFDETDHMQADLENLNDIHHAVGHKTRIGLVFYIFTFFRQSTKNLHTVVWQA